MNLRPLLFASLLLAVLPAASRAGAPAVVTLAAPESVTVARRHSTTAVLKVTVKEGYHVQANPASADYLIPTRLELAKARGLKVGKIGYPAPKMFTLEGSTDKLATFQGTFEIRVPVRATDDARAGEQVLKGTLRFQACDDKACLAPTSLPVELKLTVAARK